MGGNGGEDSLAAGNRWIQQHYLLNPNSIPGLSPLTYVYSPIELAEAYHKVRLPKTPHKRYSRHSVDILPHEQLVRIRHWGYNPLEIYLRVSPNEYCLCDQSGIPLILFWDFFKVSFFNVCFKLLQTIPSMWNEMNYISKQNVIKFTEEKVAG